MTAVVDALRSRGRGGRGRRHTGGSGQRAGEQSGRQAHGNRTKAMFPIGNPTQLGTLGYFFIQFVYQAGYLA